MLLYEGNDLGDEENWVTVFNLGVVKWDRIAACQRHVKGVLEWCQDQNGSLSSEFGV